MDTHLLDYILSSEFKSARLVGNTVDTELVRYSSSTAFFQTLLLVNANKIQIV